MCGAPEIVNPTECGLSPDAMNDPDKQARLAQALRDNLRRRKAQARGEGAEPAPRVEAPEPETPRD